MTDVHSRPSWTETRATTPLSQEHEGYDRSLVRDLEKFPELGSTVALMHAVLLVNSVSHMYGRRRFRSPMTAGTTPRDACAAG